MKLLVRVAWCLVCAILCGTSGFAEDVYLIRVRASAFPPGLSWLNGFRWETETVLVNPTTGTRTIRLKALNGSNQLPAGESPTLEIPAGRSLRLEGSVEWKPEDAGPVWVNRIEVPSDVLVQHRLKAVELHCINCGGVGPATTNGVLDMPVFRRLTEPGETKYHLGADMDGRDNRTNVTIYNDGPNDATATIQIVSECQDRPLATLELYVPARSVRQLNAAPAADESCGARTRPNQWSRYVTVRMNAPGLSYVSNVIAEGVPKADFRISAPQ